MDVLGQIRRPIEAEMVEFEQLFRINLQHSNELLNVALSHVLNRKGKMMRPILTLLSAKLAGRVTPQVLHAAVSLEMLHTASLVHDDVVDDSNERRGQVSLNKLMGNKVAVLVGDYLLSTSLQHASLARNLQVVERVAELGKTLSNGELSQLNNVKSDEISEEQYFKVIEQKTASLFATCAHVGATLSGASDAYVRKLTEFAKLLGICFQIRDDIFDYFSDNNVGKPTGNDMQEGKLTLPVIYAVNQSGTEQWYALALKVRSGKASSQEIAQLVAYTIDAGGIEYARDVMHKIRLQALTLLENEENEVAHSLRLYLNFALKRAL